MTRTTRLLKWLGSLRIAVPLLIAIAAVLAWGTMYETRFGTAAVQRFIYRAWWFQALLAFLASNLALAAFERYPWKRPHLPFVLAHLGIILVLVGGIIGGRFGVEGQLFITEGQAEQVMQQPGNLLVIRQPNPGVSQAFPTRFETQAWVREPHTVFPVALDGRQVELVVDRYYPDAVTTEEISGDGTEENPAVRLLLEHAPQQDELWLFARDPERFGAGWGPGHALFLSPASLSELDRVLNPQDTGRHPRGSVTLHFAQPDRTIEVPVPDELGRPIALAGTPYRVIFKDYFPDFVIAEQGPVSRSSVPNNPAVAFALAGPEGTDTHLLFALHPEIAAMHGWAHAIKVEATYTHPANEALPPNTIAIVLAPSGELAAVMTGAAGERQTIRPVTLGTRYTQPWSGDAFTVTAFHPRAAVISHISNRSDDVKAEMLHLVAREGGETAETWVSFRGTAPLALGKEPLEVTYRPEERALPFTVKLLDFRKIDYPGIDMAAGFESDVQLTDSQRGLILMRTIKMNEPLRHRGYSLFQSSYIPGAVETTILSVRNDPGTPLVYAGFLIVVGGMVALFMRRLPQSSRKRKGTRA